MTTFDANATLVSDRLHLRPLQESDRDALYAAASDPETWAQHPASNRHEQEVFYPYFDYRLASGGTLAVSVRDTSEVIGCSRFYPVPDHPGEYGIGFTFLARSHWGGSWNKRRRGWTKGSGRIQMADGRDGAASSKRETRNMCPNTDTECDADGRPPCRHAF